MNILDTVLNIRTLGSFRISAKGKPVAVDWPNETQKVLFCSLLSPLGESISWDRISRSLWDIPATATTRFRLEETVIRPLTRFLITEFGFNPLIEGNEGMSVNLQYFDVDALEFYKSAVEGFRLMSIGNYAAAFKRFRRADELYIGSYLPGMPGKVIADTRYDLDSLYRTAVKHAMPRIYNSGCSSGQKREVHGMSLLAA